MTAESVKTEGVVVGAQKSRRSMRAVFFYSFAILLFVASVVYSVLHTDAVKDPCSDSLVGDECISRFCVRAEAAGYQLTEECLALLRRKDLDLGPGTERIPKSLRFPQNGGPGTESLAPESQQPGTPSPSPAPSPGGGGGINPGRGGGQGGGGGGGRGGGGGGGRGGGGSNPPATVPPAPPVFPESPGNSDLCQKHPGNPPCQ